MNQPTSLKDLSDSGLDINIIINNNGQLQLGDVLMHSKKTGDITGNTFGDNVAIQSDNVVQTKTVKSNEFDNAFAELIKDIHNNTNDANKETALFIAEQLKEAYTSNQKEKASKPFNLLRKILGDVGSLASIASICGLSF